MTDNDFHQDAPISDQHPVSVQLGLTVLELREIAKIPELLTRAKQSIESGVSAFRAAAEYLADAQELGVSQRQLADEVGKSAAWVNALLKWRERGYPDGTPFRPQAKARPRLVKAVQETEQNGWEATDRPAITHEQVEITASGSLLDTAMVEADTPVEAEVAKREDVAAPDATTTSRPKVKLSSAQRGLLVNTLGALGSSKPGVRDHAARAVGRQLIRLGLKWEHLIIPANEFEA